MFFPPFQNHQGVCPQESVYCENKCGARMMRRLLSQHSMSECPKRTQPCKYCGKEFVFDTIQVSLPSLSVIVSLIFGRIKPGKCQGLFTLRM